MKYLWVIFLCSCSTLSDNIDTVDRVKVTKIPFINSCEIMAGYRGGGIHCGW